MAPMRWGDGVVVEEPSQRRDWTAHGLFAAAAEESKGD